MHVLVADSHAEVRWALSTFLREELGLITVSEAREAGELLSGVAARCPDLIFLQWELPGPCAAEVLAALRTLDLDTPVIVLAQRAECLRPATEAGADGFVCKTASPQQLLRTLPSVLERRGADKRDANTSWRSCDPNEMARRPDLE